VVSSSTWIKKDISKRHREFYFAAASEEERDEWITTVEFLKAIAVHRSFQSSFGVKLTIPLKIEDPVLNLFDRKLSLSITQAVKSPNEKESKMSSVQRRLTVKSLSTISQQMQNQLSHKAERDLKESMKAMFNYMFVHLTGHLMEHSFNAKQEYRRNLHQTPRIVEQSHVLEAIETKYPILMELRQDNPSFLAGEFIGNSLRGSFMINSEQRKSGPKEAILDAKKVNRKMSIEPVNMEASGQIASVLAKSDGINASKTFIKKHETSTFLKGAETFAANLAQNEQIIIESAMHPKVLTQNTEILKTEIDIGNFNNQSSQPPSAKKPDSPEIDQSVVQSESDESDESSKNNDKKFEVKPTKSVPSIKNEENNKKEIKRNSVEVQNSEEPLHPIPTGQRLSVPTELGRKSIEEPSKILAFSSTGALIPKIKIDCPPTEEKNLEFIENHDIRQNHEIQEKYESFENKNNHGSKIHKKYNESKEAAFSGFEEGHTILSSNNEIASIMRVTIKRHANDISIVQLQKKQKNINEANKAYSAQKTITEERRKSKKSLRDASRIMAEVQKFVLQKFFPQTTKHQHKPIFDESNSRKIQYPFARPSISAIAPAATMRIHSMFKEPEEKKENSVDDSAETLTLTEYNDNNKSGYNQTDTEIASSYYENNNKEDDVYIEGGSAIVEDIQPQRTKIERRFGYVIKKTQSIGGDVFELKENTLVIVEKINEEDSIATVSLHDLIGLFPLDAIKLGNLVTNEEGEDLKEKGELAKKNKMTIEIQDSSIVDDNVEENIINNVKPA